MVFGYENQIDNEKKRWCVENEISKSHKWILNFFDLPNSWMVENDITEM